MTDWKLISDRWPITIFVARITSGTVCFKGKDFYSVFKTGDNLAFSGLHVPVEVERHYLFPIGDNRKTFEEFTPLKQWQSYKLTFFLSYLHFLTKNVDKVIA